MSKNSSVEGSVARVTKPRHDVAALIQLRVYHGGVDGEARVPLAQQLERRRRAHDAAERGAERAAGRLAVGEVEQRRGSHRMRQAAAERAAQAGSGGSGSRT